ncbi:MAG: tetratricopeptide repeat protein, partial [Armatimonadota bacterium]
YKQMNKPADVVPYVEELYKKNPTSVGFQQVMVLAYQNAGMYEKAVDVLKAMIENRPDMTAVEYLIDGFEKLGKIDDAIQYLETLYRNQSSDNTTSEASESRTILRRGVIVAYRTAGKHDNAISLLREDIEKDPQDTNGSRMYLAEYLTDLKRYDDAITEYQALRQVKPGDDGVYIDYKLAGVYKEKGDKQRALEIYKKVLEKWPGNTMLKDEISNLEKELSSSSTKEEIKQSSGGNTDPAGSTSTVGSSSDSGDEKTI